VTRGRKLDQDTSAQIVSLRRSGLSFGEIGQRLNMLPDTCQKHYNMVACPVKLPQSTMPVYNKPLQVEGNALVLNDLEVPFHHADFVNRCIELAVHLGINQLILGGDVCHLDALSAWGAAWQEQRKPDTISEQAEKDLRAEIQKLPPENQGALLDALTRLAENRASEDDEIKAGARVLKMLAQTFTGIYYVLGNHDDRFLRKLQAPLTPDSLLNFLGLTDPTWHIKPYFFACLTSAGERWRIEHQRSAAPNCAVRLADKYECHVIVAHNHSQSEQWSTSGRYYAISSGCCVDEERLPYASQRSTNRPAHHLGAVIVLDGCPIILHSRSPWARMMRM